VGEGRAPAGGEARAGASSAGERGRDRVRRRLVLLAGAALAAGLAASAPVLAVKPAEAASAPLVSVSTSELDAAARPIVLPATLAPGDVLQVTFNQAVSVDPTSFSLELTDGVMVASLDAADATAVASGSTLSVTAGPGAPAVSLGVLEILGATGVTAASSGAPWNLVLSGEASRVDSPKAPTTCTPVYTRVFGGTNCSIGFTHPGPTVPDVYDVIAVPTIDLPGPPLDTAPEVITNCGGGSTDTVYDTATGTVLGQAPCGTYDAGEPYLGNTTSSSLDYIPTPALRSFEPVGVVETLPNSPYVSATAVPPLWSGVSVSGNTATFTYDTPVSCQSPGSPNTYSQFTFSAPWWSTDSVVYASAVTCPATESSQLTVTFPETIPSAVHFKYTGYGYDAQGVGYFVVGGSSSPLAGEREASQSAYAGPAAAPADPSIATFGAGSVAASPGGASVSLSYAVSDATRCEVTVSPSDGVQVSLPYATLASDPAPASLVPCPDALGTGTVTFPPNTSGAPQRYELVLRAAGLAGSTAAEAQTTVEVPPAPPGIANLSVSPSSLGAAGGTATVTYATSNATSCELAATPSVAGSGALACGATSATVSIPANSSTTALAYLLTLTATGPGGSTSASVELSVAPATPPPTPPAGTSAPPTSAPPATLVSPAPVRRQVPEVASLVPRSAPPGRAVVIVGDHFTERVAVRFGALLARQVRVLSPTRLRAVVPRGAGRVRVSVHTAYGTSQPAPGAVFTFARRPS